MAGLPRAMNVAYAPLSTSVGRLWMAASDAGVLRIALGSPGERAFVHDLTRRAGSPAVLLKDTAALRELGRQLLEYFDGRRKSFDLPIDLSGVSPFQRRVLEAAREIRYGAVLTYGALASAIGMPGAARAVGGALGANPIPILVPCHRIVAADGGLGGFTVKGCPDGLGLKRRLLALEGARL